MSGKEDPVGFNSFGANSFYAVPEIPDAGNDECTYYSGI